MPTQKLTQRFVDALPPSEKLTLYFDESMKGFGVYTTANAKTYFIQARVNGKEKKRSIGKASLMKLDAARTEAREILALMAKGVDPVEEEKKHQLCSMTLSQAFERYCSTRSLKAGTIAMVAGLLWGARLGVQFSLSLVVLKALPVLVLGGFDSILGAIVGGLIVGALEKLAEVYLGPWVGGGIEGWFAYVAALAFLLVKPGGLFGQRLVERA